MKSMPYEILIGNISLNATPDEEKTLTSDTGVVRLSFLGGRAEVKQRIQIENLSPEHEQAWNEFTSHGVRFYALEAPSEEEGRAKLLKLVESSLPLIFFAGTHGSGEGP